MKEILILNLAMYTRTITNKCINDLKWSFLTFSYTDNFVYTRIIESFSTCFLISSYKNALLSANLMLNEPEYNNYIIKTINLSNLKWENIISKAKNLAPLEIKSILKNNKTEYKDNLFALHKIIDY